MGFFESHSFFVFRYFLIADDRMCYEMGVILDGGVIGWRVLDYDMI